MEAFARRRPGAFVRLKHPLRPLYYCSATADWVERGYTIWTAAEWTAKFGHQAHEGRVWEYFGEDIPLYDDDEQID